MTSKLYQMTFMEDRNLFAEPAGGKPMGDIDCGLITDDALKTGIDLIFSHRVKRCGRLIQKDERGIFVHCAGDRNFLCLAAADFNAVFIIIFIQKTFNSMRQRMTVRIKTCIAKAGISMITKLFAVRLAEMGISVIEIRPGIIETDMTAKVKEKSEAMIADGIPPIKRMGQPEDIAKCVAAVADGNFDFCTGTVIDCDGGFSVRCL